MKVITWFYSNSDLITEISNDENSSPGDESEENDADSSDEEGHMPPQPKVHFLVCAFLILREP